MDSKECSSFPSELWEEILCRVPTKSLLRFKLTCKRWLALFQDKRFIYKHLTCLLEQIIRTNHMVKIINPVIEDCSSLSLPFEFQFKPEIHNMVHCDELLLCILESGLMAVWNPCLNKVRWIKSMVLSPVCCFYGIGYNGLCRDGYKILRFMNSVFTNSNAKIDIYELNSTSWKKLLMFLWIGMWFLLVEVCHSKETCIGLLKGIINPIFSSKVLTSLQKHLSFCALFPLSMLLHMIL